MGRSKGTAAAETARASQGLQRRGVDDTLARRRWGNMEDGAEVDGAKSDIYCYVQSENISPKHPKNSYTAGPSYFLVLFSLHFH